MKAVVNVQAYSLLLLSQWQNSPWFELVQGWVYEHNVTVV